MTTDQECEDYARECERLAGLSKDPQRREQLIIMAHEWRAVAIAPTPGPLLSVSPDFDFDVRRIF